MTGKLDKLCFIDEVGFNISMRCRYGWAESGKNANKVISQLRSKNLSVCALFGVMDMNCLNANIQALLRFFLPSSYVTQGINDCV